MVGVPGIYNFYRHVEARAIDMDPDEDSDDDEVDANNDRRGPLFVGHNWTVRRARRLGPNHAIRVVRWWKSGVCVDSNAVATQGLVLSNKKCQRT